MLLPLEKRNIYFDLLGPDDGPVVCFGHSLSSDSGMWAEQVPALLAEGFRVLRIDMRGHGGSDVVPGNCTIEQLADDTACVLDALEIPQVHFIGLSIGGMFGQALGFRHGGKIRSLMLCATRGTTQPHDPAQRAAILAKVREADSLAAMADGVIERWFTPAFKQRHRARWQQIYDGILCTKAQAYISCSMAIHSFDFTTQLPDIKAPTLVMRGAGDLGGATRDEGQRLASLIPNSKYDEIPQARHLSNVEFPGKFNRMMLDWLQAHR